jgi:hypothetical protein
MKGEGELADVKRKNAFVLIFQREVILYHEGFLFKRVSSPRSAIEKVSMRKRIEKPRWFR